MEESEINRTFAAVSALWDRIRRDSEQPTDEIAALAEATFASVKKTIGARRWHQVQLEKLVAALNDHRRKRQQHPATTMWLMVALKDIADLVEPMERVAEDLRTPADEARVDALLDEIRTWRSV